MNPRHALGPDRGFFRVGSVERSRGAAAMGNGSNLRAGRWSPGCERATRDRYCRGCQGMRRAGARSPARPGRAPTPPAGGTATFRHLGPLGVMCTGPPRGGSRLAHSHAGRRRRRSSPGQPMPRSPSSNALRLSMVADPPWAWWLFCSLSFAGLFFWAMFVAWTPIVTTGWWVIPAHTACIWLILATGVMVCASASCTGGCCCSFRTRWLAGTVAVQQAAAGDEARVEQPRFRSNRPRASRLSGKDVGHVEDKAVPGRCPRCSGGDRRLPFLAG